MVETYVVKLAPGVARRARMESLHENNTLAQMLEMLVLEALAARTGKAA